MAEFAAGARGFAVEMEMSVGDGEDFGGVGEVANQIEHGAVAGRAGRAEREAEYGAKMIFELAGDGAFDCPVAGIVHARRHFVGQKFVLMLKKFKSKHADVFQGFEHPAGGLFSGALDGRIEARRRGD